MNGRVGPASGNDCLQHLAGRRSRSILWPGHDGGLCDSLAGGY